MTLEILPNELLLNLFDYLSLIQLFQIFYGLNSRLSYLVLTHCRQCHLDFRQMTKTNFDVICHNYLPSIVNGIVSLGLSDDDGTPQQIDLFLSHNYRLRHFINLRTISLSNVHCLHSLDKLLTECFHVISLRNLTIADSHITASRNVADDLYDKIWKLSKLTYCYIDINFSNSSFFPTPTIASTSLTHLSLPNISCNFDEFTRLLRLTPNLQRVLIDAIENPVEYELCLPRLSITHLKLSVENSWNMLQKILQSTPNLYHLTLETSDIYVSGHRWKELIGTYLLELKVFRFKMRFSSSSSENKETQVNEILDSFRTTFWIDEHQWFVRCHWYSSEDPYRFDFIDLFTLPYAFKEFLSYTGCSLTKSTCPDDDEYWSYDRVSNLCYASLHFNNSIISRIHFSNIESLSLLLPLNDQFVSVVTKLDRLKSLFISMSSRKKRDDNIFQLQMILNNAPRLYSFSIGSWSSLSLPSSLLTNATKSIRRLNFQGYCCGKNWCYFDDELCRQLSSSSLGRQCETLLINVKNRSNVLDLVKHLPNLRALSVCCEDDLWEHPTIALRPKEDEHLEWLRLWLPSSTSITRDTHFTYNIRLWIR